MNTTFTRLLYTALLAVVMFTSCSRPVAYFQRGSGTASVAVGGQTGTTTAPVQRLTEPMLSLEPANTTVDQSEAYARKDSRPATDKTLNKRMVGIGKVLAYPDQKLGLQATNTPQKMNGVQRLLLRKLNKHLSKTLAPSHPEKAMVMKGKLIGSVVLLIAGLLMLIMGTGTLAFIGLIVGLIGALGTIVSLFGI